jgi:hypothetical protein
VQKALPRALYDFGAEPSIAQKLAGGALVCVGAGFKFSQGVEKRLNKRGGASHGPQLGASASEKRAVPTRSTSRHPSAIRSVDQPNDASARCASTWRIPSNKFTINRTFAGKLR